MTPSNRTVTAAATRVRLDDAPSVKRALALRQDWQKLAWNYYDAVGELKYAINLIGSACSRIRLVPAEIKEPGAPPSVLTAEDDSGRFKDAMSLLDTLRGPTGSHAEMMRELAIHLEVAGEGYLIGAVARDEFAEDRWFVASVDELKKKSGHVIVSSARLPYDETTLVLTEDDFWARIWRRHPRRSDHADSPVRGVLNVCEELVTLDRAVKAVAQSGISTRKLVAIPDDINPAGTYVDTQDEGDGELVGDPFLADLMDMFVTPVQKEGTVAQVAPYLLRYPWRSSKPDLMSGIEVIDVGRELDAAFDARTDRALRRLAQGLQLPPELIFGLSQATHWGSGQIEESLYREHIEPLAALIVSSLTEVYYRPAAEELGLGPLLVWLDPSELIVRPDTQQAADYGHRSMLISDDSWRNQRGFSDSDKPTPKEVERRIAIEQALRMPGMGVPELEDSEDEEEKAETDAAAKEAQLVEPPTSAIGVPAPRDETRTPDEAVLATGPDGELKLGAELRALDDMLRLQLHEAAEAALERTIERAEAKVVSRARADSVLSLRAKNAERGWVVTAVGGEEALERFSLSAVDLVGGTFASVARRLETQTAKVFAVVLDAAGVTRSQRTALKQQAAHRAHQAGEWLARELEILAMDQLLRPRAVTFHDDEPGEKDPDARVPFHLIREAVARAGGANGQGVTAAMAAPTLVAGIGVSDPSFDVLAEAGIGTEAWRWVYGVYPRMPFPPHKQLDGVMFDNFDDQVLAFNSWPGGFLYPGDHSGCRCSIEPVMRLIAQQPSLFVVAEPSGAALVRMAEGFEQAETLRQSAQGKLEALALTEGLTTAEQATLDSYMGFTYRSINDRLRGRKVSRTSKRAYTAEEIQAADEHIAGLDALFGKFNMRIERPLFVARGVNFAKFDSAVKDAYLTPGSVIREPAFISASTNIQSAWTVARDDKEPALLVIEVPAQKRVLPGTHYEDELILERGQELEIVDVIPATEETGWMLTILGRLRG